MASQPDGPQGRPARREVTLGVADITELEKRYVNDALDHNRLSSGRYTRAFERGFAEQHGCRHGIACNSGTSALQIALAALKEVRAWEDGDDVLIPAVTFIATSNIVLHNRMVPRFVDVDPATYNMNPDLVEAQISDRTRAIIPVHLFGLPCEMDPLLDVARAYDLEVIEDSCETMFARYKGRPVGSFGAIGCFSTYVAHLLVTGVGGLLTTNNDEYALICRSLLAHGRDAIYLNIDDDDNVSDNQLRDIVARRFSFVRLGFSYRITELEGALGLAQLERQEGIMERRRQVARALLDRLRPFEAFLQLPSWPAHSDHAFMLFPIVVREAMVRDGLVMFLERHGIETRYMFPLLSQPVYRKLFGDLEERYPVARMIRQCGFYIGCHHKLTDDDVAYVAGVFGDYFHGGR